MAVVWVLTLTIGLMVLALTSPITPQLFSPGPLALQHGQIGECGDCHIDFDDTPLRWLHAAFEANEPQKDSRLCLNCHQFGADPLSPHGVGRDLLAQMTRAAESNARQSTPPGDLALATVLFDRPTAAAPDGLACATCHREHHGADFELTYMSDQQCQSCHSLQFDSFAKGHPDFGAWPYERRTRINFDHASHFGRHFEKAGLDNAPAGCSDCHRPSGNGQAMLAGSFEATCSACHVEQIAGAEYVGVKGIPFLAVPGLDLTELRARGADIGEWPGWSAQQLPPIMKALLAADPTTAAAVERLETLDALDLTGLSDEDLAAVEQVAWGVKELFHDLILEGGPVLEQRLSQSLGMSLDGTATARMAGVVPLDVLRSAQQDWFPSLFKEVARHRLGIAVPLADSTEEEVGGPTATENTDGTQEEAGNREEQSDILGDHLGILDEQADILDNSPGILEGDQGILGGDRGILEGDQKILEEDQGTLESDLFGGAPVNSSPLASTGDGLAGQADAIGEAADPNKISTETWADWGGWYRRDFTLYYRPVGHADRFSRTWLDISAAAVSTPTERLATPIFDALAADNSPSKCTKCHSVDREVEGTLNVKWRAFRSDPRIRTGTHFSHATHFSLLDERGCRTCHNVNNETDYQAGYDDFDPLIFQPGFQPMRAATCRDCHSRQVAGESCLLCHSYHLGEALTVPVSTEMTPKHLVQPDDER